MTEEYPVLIGHSVRTEKKLFDIEQVADFICEQGMYGEVTVEKRNRRLRQTAACYLRLTASTLIKSRI